MKILAEKSDKWQKRREFREIVAVHWSFLQKEDRKTVRLNLTNAFHNDKEKRVCRFLLLC